MHKIRSEIAAKVAKNVLDNWEYGNDQYYDSRTYLQSFLPDEIIEEIINILDRKNHHSSEKSDLEKLTKMTLDLGNGFVSRIVNSSRIYLPHKLDKNLLIPWENGFRVFVSSSKDSVEYLRNVEEIMEPFQFSFFIHYSKNQPFTNWKENLLQAISTCDLFLFMSSEYSNRSIWCNQEIGFAIGGGIPVISISNGQFPQGFIQDYHSLNPDFIKNEQYPLQIITHILDSEELRRKYLHSINFSKLAISFFKNTRLDVLNLHAKIIALAKHDQIFFDFMDVQGMDEILNRPYEQRQIYRTVLNDICENAPYTPINDRFKSKLHRLIDEIDDLTL